MYVFESIAEALSVWFDDPILGMLQFMNFWFGAFLFGGFLIPLRNMFWPFELFYYIMPFSYYIRAQMYTLLSDTTWSECDPENNVDNSPVCVAPPTGKNVLDGIGLSYPVVESNDTFWEDFGVMVAIGLFYRILYVIGVYVKSSQTAKVHPTEYYEKAMASKVEDPVASAPSLSRMPVDYEQDPVMHVDPVETDVEL